MANKSLILVSGSVVFKDSGKNRRWFVVKQGGDGKWEIPKVIVRKTESSVRASLRMMGEQGGMRAKVLEEAGRAGGVTTTNGRTIPQRYLYYLMAHKADSGESIGFEESAWLDYSKAVRKISSKRERLMLRQARKELKAWEKRRKKKRLGGVA